MDNKNAVVNRNNGDSLRDSGQTANQAESIRRHKYETKYESCKEETKKHETNKHKTNKYDTICELSCNSNSIDYGMQLIDEPAAVIFPANQCAKAGKHFSQHLRRQLGLKRTDEGHGL